jgi:signal transduction histidine kinase
MGLRRRDTVSVALVAIAGFWGLASWWGGGVSLGINLGSGDGQQVRLGYINPESVAWRAGFWPGAIVTDLKLIDGSEVIADGAATQDLTSAEVIGTTLIDSRIAHIEVLAGPTGGLDLSGGTLTLSRSQWEERLAGSVWFLILGAALGITVGWLVRGAALGAAWRDSAVPIAAAVSIPLLAVPIRYGGTGYEIAFGAYLLPALGALPAAHVLAERRSSTLKRRSAIALAVGLALGVSVWTLARFGGGEAVYVDDRLLRYLLLAAIPLVPATIAALDVGRSALDRMELMAIGLTAAAAMTVLPRTHADLWPLLIWLAVLIIWRRFSIAPLLRIAERTQRQRDLAVAAAEAERARLASDLHDDALQDLTAIMRRFDVAGDAAGAEMARHVAERLRAICSDLRLPLLKTMGAGAALEWLVDRVTPLADGPVRLERHDGSRPPAPVELAIFRVAQEALANAVRHGAAPVNVCYRADAEGASLTVEDAGPGIADGASDAALAAGHFGLAAMQQRAEQIGANLDIRSWPGGGTVIALHWRAG